MLQNALLWGSCSALKAQCVGRGSCQGLRAAVPPPKLCQGSGIKRELRYPKPVLSCCQNSMSDSEQTECLPFITEKGERQISVLQQVQGSCPELCQGGGTACGLGCKVALSPCCFSSTISHLGYGLTWKSSG